MSSACDWGINTTAQTVGQHWNTAGLHWNTKLSCPSCESEEIKKIHSSLCLRDQQAVVCTEAPVPRLVGQARDGGNLDLLLHRVTYQSPPLTSSFVQIYVQSLTSEPKLKAHWRAEPCPGFSWDRVNFPPSSSCVLDLVWEEENQLYPSRNQDKPLAIWLCIINRPVFRDWVTLKMSRTSSP